MKAVLIHGALQSGRSFNYIKKEIELECIVVEYNTRDRFQTILDNIQLQLFPIKEKLFFIGHSLGGLLSVALYGNLKSRAAGGITIATPFGGIAELTIPSFILPKSSITDCSVFGQAIRKHESVNIEHPWWNVVTTGGNNPYILGCNDGVIRIESQKRDGMNTVFSNCSHHEVLMVPETISVINQAIATLKE